MPTNYVNIIEKLSLLELQGMLDYLDNVVDKNLPFLDSLNILLDRQIERKKENVYKAGIKVSHFPFIKTIDDFDFNFQPTLNKEYIYSLLSLRFLKENENIIFIGNPGTGKTHLATAIGIEATRNSKSTYFITCKDLVWQLEKARSENNIERRLKHFTSYSLLIIDELGHDKLNEIESNDLFQLLQMRYEKHSTIITTNYEVNKWNSLFGDNKHSQDAMVDRLFHHCKIVKINGPSYRLKDNMEYFVSDDGSPAIP